MSRIIKATYVRVDAEPVHLTNPALAFPGVLGENGTEDGEEELSEALRLRLTRIQQMERALEEQRQQQLAEIDQFAQEERAAIEQLRLQAQQELSAERETALQVAREEGHTSGFRQGQQDAYREAEGMREQAVVMLREAAQEAERRVLEGERNILELTLAIARKVLETELNEREELILQQIRLALRQFKQVPQIIIKVPQSRYALVQDNLSRLKEEFRQVLALDCLADPSLPQTDVVLDSPFGRMDVRFDAQLEILQQSLMELLKEQTL